MNEQEAIKRIRKEICCEKPIQHYCKDACIHGKEQCEYQIAIKALEKQIPKKPVYSKGYMRYARCPVCNDILSLLSKYCRECGNKLDWTVEE